jgi:protein SCO1
MTGPARGLTTARSGPRTRGRRRLAMRRALVLAAVAPVFMGSLAPSLARADGDPASDILQSQTAFVPADAGFSSQQQSSLSKFLQASAKAGFPVRVAIIPEAYDLGYVTQLWAKPRTYAQFLGIELSLVFKGPLLVVMRNGFGFYWAGHSTTSSHGTLSGIATNPGSAGLLDATEAAVRRVAGSNGVQLGAAGAGAAAASSHGDGAGAGVAILIAALAALAVVCALLVAQRRRARVPTASSESPAAPESVSVGQARRSSKPSALPLWLRLAIPASLSLLAIVVIVGQLVLRNAHRSAEAAPSSVEGSPSETAPVKWQQGSRAAPDFTLTDQQGLPVSVAAYRGRPVIVTFIDPLCRELCPLAAQVLSRAERQLPPSQQPEIIAVSVNIYDNARANLLQDFSRWHLTPQWRWAVGNPKQLASVWKRYDVEVDVTRKHIAGTTVHYLAHSEMAYVVDPGGYERDLLLWPYTADQVENAVRSF